jgi:hypothetical protein
MLNQIKHKVTLSKQYAPPIKRHEVRQNNPFFNGAFVGYCKAYGDSKAINKSISSSIGDIQPTNATSVKSPGDMDDEEMNRSPSTDRTFGIGSGTVPASQILI